MPPTSPRDDLVPPHMLPGVPTIKPGAGFGDDIKTPKKSGGKYKGGKITPLQEGGSVRNAPNPYYGRSPTQPYDKRKYVNFPGGRSDKDIATPVIPDPVKYPEYIEEVGEERVSGPRMRKGGMVKSSASKRADGIAQRGKTRGRMV